ncbi:MAG: GntR family transcriptional regulator [Lachnospiraceae bacterium]|nr:GntR family transcriptional regulator [Lachnospiraceae bacterium]MDD7051084.1 GntR family transcriptional regulator [Lachnospiraceae bacterium]MDY4095384.1 GntR family transcriptional regulator [Lachnospiraceae bacterium]
MKIEGEAAMNIVIQPQGTLAIYEQIVNQLKNLILTHQLAEGEALPSIRTLAGDLGVSVITTKRAYEELEKEGLIRSVPGKGFYVCEYNSDYLMEKQLMEWEKRLAEIIGEAKQAGVTTRQIKEMVDTLFMEG